MGRDAQKSLSQGQVDPLCAQILKNLFGRPGRRKAQNPGTLERIKRRVDFYVPSLEAGDKLIAQLKNAVAHRFCADFGEQVQCGAQAKQGCPGWSAGADRFYPGARYS